jgi:hypothetical protein
MYANIDRILNSQTGIPFCQDSRNTNVAVINPLSQHAQVCK